MSLSPSSKPRRAFWGVLFLLLLALTEGLARLVGAVLGPAVGLDIRPPKTLWAQQTEQLGVLLDDTTGLVVLDSLLGWRYRPGYATETQHMNSGGHHAQREYAEVRPAGRRRIAAFGDSFVYATEVSTPDSWSSQLEALRAPSLEVLNYGVGGYGTDQAFLYFLRDGMRFSPEVVLIGFAPVNLSRIENVYRRFLSTQDLPLVKPRFVRSESGALALLANPLPTRADWERLRATPGVARELGRHDAWYDPLRYENLAYEWSAAVRLATAVGLRVWRRYLWPGRLQDGEAFRSASPAFALQRAVLEAFADSVRRRGPQPVLLFLPSKPDVQAIVGGGRPSYAPLRDSLARSARAPILDLAEAFAAEGGGATVDAWFAPGGHYSPAGNSVVARWLSRQPLIVGTALERADGPAPVR